jgi:hypothetical protein
MINLKEARHVIATAETKAHEIGQPMNIAVVDAGARGFIGDGTPRDRFSHLDPVHVVRRGKMMEFRARSAASIDRSLIIIRE